MATGTDNTLFDVIVIGAGINGAGIARDAALRGLKALLLDKEDMSGGTTATSSRLIHGGLRYLEHYEVALVRESLRERERLLAVAPHLVKPLPLTLPIYAGHKRGPLLIRLGMIAYDVLSYDKSLPRHTMYAHDAALKHEPGLARDGLRAAARYYDAQVTFPERLVVENVLDALAHGADVHTYARVDDLLVEAGVVRGVRYVDALTGDATTALGKVTINVAGPWVDDVLAELGHGAPSRRLVGGTKGSHIVVHPFAGAPKDALYIEARQDGRPYFIIPWNGLYLIGTTDVRYDGDTDHVVASEEEIAYLLAETNLAIPEAGLTREDVLYTFAGLRPLPYKEDGAEAAITRQHIIKDHAPRIEGLFSIIGGKLTTYRELAEQAVDAAYSKLGRTAPRSRTGDLPLPGGVRLFDRFADRFRHETPDWLTDDAATWLLTIYGTRARDVVALAERDPSLREPLGGATPAIAAVIPFAFTHEHA
ncbi:MAG TPA: glycerol-3-phosphate dehydrogenase/oxidase, partial [Thermomicrobiales bacterium]|nr:glycerol-3-phosphate dehydrogenase/oxidase [Thermomicrobiales bacterium]